MMALLCCQITRALRRCRNIIISIFSIMIAKIAIHLKTLKHFPQTLMAHHEEFQRPPEAC